jgi:hypothetical protein
MNCRKSGVNADNNVVKRFYSPVKLVDVHVHVHSWA